MKYKSFQRIAVNLQVREERERQRWRERGKKSELASKPTPALIIATLVFTPTMSNKLVQVTRLDNIRPGTSQQA